MSQKKEIGEYILPGNNFVTHAVEFLVSLFFIDSKLIFNFFTHQV